MRIVSSKITTILYITLIRELSLLIMLSTQNNMYRSSRAFTMDRFSTVILNPSTTTYTNCLFRLLFQLQRIYGGFDALISMSLEFKLAYKFQKKLFLLCWWAPIHYKAERVSSVVKDKKGLKDEESFKSWCFSLWLMEIYIII